jgi:hypothetical protein
MELEVAKAFLILVNKSQNSQTRKTRKTRRKHYGGFGGRRRVVNVMSHGTKCSQKSCSTRDFMSCLSIYRYAGVWIEQKYAGGPQITRFQD